MVNNEVSLTSLCYLAEDYNGRVWLQRLADVDDDDRLQEPMKSYWREGNYFENRDRLYQNDGPTTIGAVGVWDWTAIPNREKPSTDFVQSYFVEELRPIRVVVVDAKSLEEVVDQLKSGIVRTQDYFCDTYFCFTAAWGQLSGVLCRLEDFDIIDKCVVLSDQVYSLPSYSMKVNDVYNWNDKNLRFSKSFQLGEPSGHISLGSADEIIRTIVLERLTWPLCKETIGATKAEWRNCKTLLERICDESLYDAVEKRIKCTPEQAKKTVDGFVARAYDQIEAGDVDADVLSKIVLQNEELKRACEAAIYWDWVEVNKEKIAEFEQDVSAAKQSIIEAEEAVVTAEKKRADILLEIDAAQAKLKQVLAEIEQYETLGNDTLVAIRGKIADAQKDMAGFIADLSVFLPQQVPQALPAQTPPSKGESVRLWTYECASEDLFAEDEIELADTWVDEINTIAQNLTSSLKVDAEYCMMLTSFLYAANHRNADIFLAGPGGHDIANTLAISIYGCEAGRLTLGNEFDCDMADGVNRYHEKMVSVQNMFGKGWSDIVPQLFVGCKKQIVWTHPYAEDMIMEPKGLYNFMLPLLADCFVGTIPAIDPLPGRRSEKFKAYNSKKTQPLRLSAFKRLGLNKLIINRLEAILSDAKDILEAPAKDKDMEVLFGLLPLCVLTGRTDILQDVVETESGISNTVKAEVSRYIKEE